MRKQIGWYRKGVGGYCSMGIKAGPHGHKFGEYDVPMFIDDEPEQPSLLWQQVMNRILVNQERMMRALGYPIEDRALVSSLFEAVARTEEIIDVVKSV